MSAAIGNKMSVAEYSAIWQQRHLLTMEKQPYSMQRRVQNDIEDDDERARQEEEKYSYVCHVYNLPTVLLNLALFIFQGKP